MKLFATVVITFSILGSSSAFGKDKRKYPLTMTAEFSEGKSGARTPTPYHSGDYDCTAGDEHNAPTCHTASEWMELALIGGTPDTVIFTMEDGAQVGVQSIAAMQSQTMNKLPDHLTCPGRNATIFCNLYDELKRMVPPPEKSGPFGQEPSQEEFMVAYQARHRELFGDKNLMTVRFSYRLKGKVESDGFQHVEVDPKVCQFCSLVIWKFGNARGDGYYPSIRH